MARYLFCLYNGAPDCKTTGLQLKHSQRGAMHIHEAAGRLSEKRRPYFHQCEVLIFRNELDWTKRLVVSLRLPPRRLKPRFQLFVRTHLSSF